MFSDAQKTLLTGKRAQYACNDERVIEGRLHFDERPGEQTWRLVEDSGEEWEIDSDAVAALDPLTDPIVIPRWELTHARKRRRA